MNSSINLNNSNGGNSIGSLNNIMNSITLNETNGILKKNLNQSYNSISSGGSGSSISNNNSIVNQVGYTIDNVVSRGNDFKYTFSLPSREQILNLKQGDLVKLIFSENSQAERMFVEIIDLCLVDTNSEGIQIFNSGDEDKSIHKDEKNKLGNSNDSAGGGKKTTSSLNDEFGYKSIKFTGILDNNPYQLRTLKLGDRIEFFDFNILSIYNQQNQLYHPDLDCVPGSIKQLFDQLCLVSNLILIDKEHIGYIFRENPTFANDSGWRIFQGDEPDDYMNKKENYQLVTIASVLNIDDSILLLLGSSFDRHFEFDSDSNIWKELVEK